MLESKFDFPFPTRKSISREEMQGIEYMEYLKGITPLELMERAGRAVADHFSIVAENKRSVVLISGGNNGGDGIVVFDLLMQTHDICLILLDPRGMKSNEAKEVMQRMIDHWKELSEAKKQTLWNVGENVYSRLMVLGTPENLPMKEMWTQIDQDEFVDILMEAEVILDAIFGLNLKSKVREPFFSYLEKLAEILRENQEKILCALDFPSGLDANTGEWHGPTLQPNYTYTFQYLKHGHVKANIEAEVLDIGIPQENLYFTNTGLFLSHWPKRDPESHKGMNGRLLVIGGSDEYTGAPLLSGNAALRVGIDTVRIVIPEKIRDILASQTKDLLLFKVRTQSHSPKNIKILKELAIKRHDSVVMGMGLSNKEPVYKFVREFIKNMKEEPIQLILDADAIRAFRGNLNLLNGTKAIMTPHRAELRHMLHEEIPSEKEELIQFLMEKARDLEVIFVLKGSTDIITDGHRIIYNMTGHPGMTVGGTGDVLAGTIGAFTTVIKDPLMAAALGCYVMGLCGEEVAKEFGNGLIASDIIPEIARRIKKLEERRVELVYHT